MCLTMLDDVNLITHWAAYENEERKVGVAVRNARQRFPFAIVNLYSDNWLYLGFLARTKKELKNAIELSIRYNSKQR